MFEDEYRALFNKFSKDLRELAKKRSESGTDDMPFDYVFYVSERDKGLTNWASGTWDGYFDGEIIENIIHNIAIDEFHDLGFTEISKEGYIDQVNGIISEIISAGDKRLETMPDDFEIPKRTY